MACETATVVKLYRGQSRVFTLYFWNPAKDGRINLTGKTVTLEDSNMLIAPVFTVLDAVNGTVKMQIEAADDAVQGLYTFRIRVGEGEENELDWPPIEVQIK